MREILQSNLVIDFPYNDFGPIIHILLSHFRFRHYYINQLLNDC